MAGKVLDRVLTFLGFEEIEEEEVAVSGTALPVHGTDAAPQDPVVSGRRAARGRRPVPSSSDAEPEFRAARTGVVRSGNVSRLVPSFPGMVVATPRRFEDAQESADNLKMGKPVILQVDGMEPDMAKRIIHFLMGATYVLGGEMHRIGPIVLFVPAGVEVTLPLGVRMAERDAQSHL